MDTLQVTIANQALLCISKARIQKMDEQTAEARACRDAFVPALKDMLRAANWNFAKKIQALALVRTEGNIYVYQKPQDCVFAIKLCGPCYNQHFELIGEEIYCSADKARLEYISDALTLNTIDPTFRTALVHRLAADICKELTGDANMQQGQYQLYQLYYAEAKQKNAQEGNKHKHIPSPYLECR